MSKPAKTTLSHRAFWVSSEKREQEKKKPRIKEKKQLTEKVKLWYSSSTCGKADSCITFFSVGLRPPG